MDSKKLYSIIIILIIILSFLSYKYNDTNKELKKYKEYYKDLSIMYLKEVIEAPKLEPPSSEEMKVTTIDFESNMFATTWSLTSALSVSLGVWGHS